MKKLLFEVPFNRALCAWAENELSERLISPADAKPKPRSAVREGVPARQTRLREK
ncbi:hypothetical protein [Streptomyces lydicus]|uniref:hypothetical protein n=1 Tax=Streptomyces lydicus TaxID=47763 RepID=UPI0012FF2533|nr:hypothetical protein [Streptomyces lydicus]MDC7339222.1 hypothetical protein [Streptomyces lydicus]UEG91269.1 hypothetical protein LJ741_12350 [Streptomyces lydicus]